MAYEFKRAPTFSEGQPITALDAIAFAESYNSRLRSGLGDGSKRIQQYVWNLFRLTRNPDDTLFPALIDALSFYSHLKPESGEVWPENEFGEPAGGNEANPLVAFIGGSPSLMGEGSRLSALLDLDYGDGTPLEIWNLGKVQRGGVSVTDNIAYQPYISASQEHFKISAFSFTSHLKSAGGYLPTPKILNWCCDESLGICVPDFEIKFTKLSDDTETIFTGTCPPDLGGLTTNVQFIQDFPFKYKVWLYDGTTQEFLKSEYIQGPYTGGGALSKPFGDQINRLLLQSYIKQFKGKQSYDKLNATSSIDGKLTGECFDIMDYAFDFQSFLTRPLLLSPVSASYDGEALNINYPFTQYTTNQATDTEHTPCVVSSPFTLGGRYIRTERLTANSSLQILLNDVIIEEVNLPSGSLNENVLSYSTPLTGSLKVKLTNPLTFLDNSGSFFAEFSLPYLQYANVWDAYTLLRMGSSLGIIEVDGTPDQQADKFEQAKQLYDSYSQYGTIVNVNGVAGIDQPLSSINTSPVYESLRQTVRGFTRVFDDAQITGYELDEEGRSVIYFKKYVNDNEDLFGWDGLLDSFNSASNGIKPDAPTGSFSNEWLLNLNFKPYNDSESSIWKPDAYSRFFPSVDRCTFLNSVIPGNHNDIFSFLQDGGSNFTAEGNLFLTSPEDTVSYLRYDRGINSGAGQPTENFYKSCMIYYPPYECQSISAVANNEIKVVLKTRLHHCPSALSAISRDIATWNTTAETWSESGHVWAGLYAEEFRSDENSLRQWLVYKALGDQADVKIGDHAARSDFDIFTDQPRGAIYPHAFFTKLLPKPFYTTDVSGSCVCEDLNKTTIQADTIVMADTYIRAMAEGYVDGLTPFTCSLTPYDTAFDYSHENLIYQATGRNRIGFVTSSLRPDNPQSYGPLPTIYPYASVLNDMSNCLNRLTDVRLPIPYKLQIRQCDYRDDSFMTPDVWINGESCNGSFSSAIKYGITGTATTLQSCGEWEEAEPNLLGDIVIGAGSGYGWAAGIDIEENGCSEDGTQFLMIATRNTLEYRFIFTDPLAVNCITPDLAENVANGSSNGFFGEEENFQSYYTTYTVDNADDSWQSALCGGTEPTTLFFNGTSGIGYNVTEHPTDTFQCKLFTSGIIDCGTPPTTTVVVGRNKGCEPDATTGTGTVKSRSIRVINTGTLVVSIPLVD